MPEADSSLLGRVADKLSQAPSYAEAGVKASILTVAAASYGSRSQDDEVTQPTGFDPEAAALFEAVVEGAYLVAHADHDFDAAFIEEGVGHIKERQVEEPRFLGRQPSEHGR